MECIFAHATKFSNAAAFALMMKIRKSYFRLSLHFKIIIQFTESILSCGMVGGWGVRERERVHWFWKQRGGGFAVVGFFFQMLNRSESAQEEKME